MPLSWGNAGAGAISGAGAGAAFGPIGAAAGGLLGGTLGLFTGGAENDKLKKIATATPEQQALHKGILTQAMEGGGAFGGYQKSQDYYNSLFSPGNEAYEKFSAPYLNQFQEQILPQIAERYAGAGALSSSGFGQALGAAGAGLQSQLAQLFAQLQSQAAGSLTSQYNQLTQAGLSYQPFALTRKKGSQGFGGPFVEGLSDKENMQGILAGIMSLFGDQQKKKGEGIE